MKGKGLGWILLIGALAVPAVLFFKWWTQMKAAQTVEARQSVPSSTPFGGSSAPSAPEPAPAAAQAEQPQDPPSGGAESPAPEAAAPAGSASPGAAAPVQAEETQSPAPEPAQAAPTGLAGKQIEYMPKTTRDPTLSVADLRELAKQRMAVEMSRRQVEEAAKPQPVAKRPPPPPLCDTIDLQGIIGTGGSIKAIVNDQIVGEGDVVDGALVERLTTRTVVFKRGRKTCMKRVTK